MYGLEQHWFSLIGALSLYLYFWLSFFFFFLSTALDTSHILLTLTTQGLMLPFLLLSLALHW